MRWSTASAWALLGAFLLSPLAGAVAPTPTAIDAGARIVSWHGFQDWNAGSYCTSDDPAVGLLSTDLTSTVRRVDEGATARFSFRFDAGAGGAVESGELCPQVALEGLAPVAWPAEGAYASGAFQMACGGAGWLLLIDHGSTIGGTLYLQSIPAACGLPFGDGTVAYFRIQEVQHASQVCTPVVLTGCTGPSTSSYPDFFCGGAPLQRESLEVVGFTLVGYYEQCHPGTGGERRAAFGDGIGLVSIVTTQDDCRVRLLDFFGGVDPVACPAGEDVVRTHPWRAVFETLP